MKVITGCNSSVLKILNGWAKQRTPRPDIWDSTLRWVTALDQIWSFLCTLKGNLGIGNRHYRIRNEGHHHYISASSVFIPSCEILSFFPYKMCTIDVDTWKCIKKTKSLMFFKFLELFNWSIEIKCISICERTVFLESILP